MTGVMAAAGLLFAPFRGLRYAEPASLASRLAPPYDVIGPDERRQLARQDPANIVNLDLPVAPPGEDPYHAAADLLAIWQRRGVLVRDTEPCAYVLRTTARLPDGVERSRTGVFLAVGTVPFAPGGRVRPHERTHAGPKEDRRRLTLATGANLSPVFLLVPDSQGQLAARLTDITAEQPWASVEALGGRHEVWIAKGSAGLRLAMLASDAQAYIADGHHRYETAVMLKNEVPGPWRAGAQRTLAHVVSFQDPGLAILPTHRVVEGRALERSMILRVANTYFARALPDQRPAFTVAFADGSEAPMTLRPDADLSKATELPAHPAVRALPVALTDQVFLKLVVEHLIGRPPSLKYTPDAVEAREAVRGGRAALTILVPPTTLEEVRAVSDAGQVMPPKSTFFAPKVPTGVVLRLFEGEG
jgi:uncharacterized protein (DUF1015 family)